MRRTDANTIKVELQKFGESTQFVELPEDSTVADLIEKAGLDE
jgi:sulfur carrier protein ThiS